MPTVITHAAVPLCLGLGLGTKVIPPRLLFAGIVLAMLPDADVLAFKFGVAYGNIFGHRGFTHSLLFAFVVPILCVLAGRRWFRASLSRCLAVFNRVAAVAQPAGFDYHRRERRRLAVALEQMSASLHRGR
jgi:Predicted membrane-bound metal-dependent hydrolases